MTPADKLAGLEKEIFAERDRKLEEARASSNSQTRVTRGCVKIAGELQTMLTWAEDEAHR